MITRLGVPRWAVSRAPGDPGGLDAQGKEVGIVAYLWNLGGEKKKTFKMSDEP